LRYALVSDIHGNLEAFKTVLAFIDQTDIDHIICLGDVVGYGPNPNECCEIVRERNIPTICGNHDAVACGLEEPYGFNPVAMAAAMWTREALEETHAEWLRELPDMLETEHFVAVHGSPNDRDFYMFTWEDILPHIDFLDSRPQRVCFFGHTHSPGIFSSDGVYTVDENSIFPLGEGKRFFINPGSVGQPRDGDARAAFGILDTEKNEFQQMRLEYDVKITADSIVAHKLPPFLAERLFLGR